MRTYLIVLLALVSLVASETTYERPNLSYNLGWRNHYSWNFDGELTTFDGKTIKITKGYIQWIDKYSGFINSRWFGLTRFYWPVDPSKPEGETNVLEGYNSDYSDDFDPRAAGTQWTVFNTYSDALKSIDSDTTYNVKSTQSYEVEYRFFLGDSDYGAGMDSLKLEYFKQNKLNFRVYNKQEEAAKKYSNIASFKMTKNYNQIDYFYRSSFFKYMVAIIGGIVLLLSLCIYCCCKHCCKPSTYP